MSVYSVTFSERYIIIFEYDCRSFSSLLRLLRPPRCWECKLWIKKPIYKSWLRNTWSQQNCFSGSVTTQFSLQWPEDCLLPDLPNNWRLLLKTFILRKRYFFLFRSCLLINLPKLKFDCAWFRVKVASVFLLFLSGVLVGFDWVILFYPFWILKH